MNEEKNKQLALSIALGASCVCNVAHEGSVCDRHQQIVNALTTARREAREEAFRDAVATVCGMPNLPRHAVYKADVIRALEVIANTQKGDTDA